MALVDYQYYISAIFNFLPANYLVDFQVINELANHGSTNKHLGETRPLVFFARPAWYLGQMALHQQPPWGDLLQDLNWKQINGDYTMDMDVPTIIGMVLFVIGAGMGSVNSI